MQKLNIYANLTLNTNIKYKEDQRVDTKIRKQKK